MDRVKFFLLGWLTIPHVLCYLIAPEKSTISIDIDSWTHKNGGIFNRIKRLIFLLTTQPEFRNVFYLRIGYLKFFLMYLPRRTNLFISVKSKDFGAGTIIQHGFSTIITAEHIGKIVS